MRGQIRLTERGEVIGSKYAHPEIGCRNLETLVAATLEATLLQATRNAPAAFLAAADMAQQKALQQKMFTQWPFFSTLLSNMDMIPR